MERHQTAGDLDALYPEKYGKSLERTNPTCGLVPVPILYLRTCNMISIKCSACQNGENLQLKPSQLKQLKCITIVTFSFIELNENENFSVLKYLFLFLLILLLFNPKVLLGRNSCTLPESSHLWTYV